MNANNDTKQTRQTNKNKPKIEKENKKKPKGSELKYDLVETCIDKKFDLFIKGIKFGNKKCEGYISF